MCGLGAFLLVAISAQAKLLNIALVDLVKRSDLIAYGETTTATSKPTRVSFRPKQILKGDASLSDGDIVLCNEPGEVESYDLRKMQTAYVVFAAKGWRCYKPVHGTSSIVQVADGAARTFAIADQPTGQPFEEFVRKIQSYVNKPSDRQ